MKPSPWARRRWQYGVARGIYVGKCAKCHEFYEPRKYSEADWRKWMGKMSEKSKLNLKQVSRIRKVAPNASAAGPMPPGEALPLASSEGTSFERALFLWHFNDGGGGRHRLRCFVAGRRYFFRGDFLA